MKKYAVILENGTTEFVDAVRYAVLPIAFGIVFYSDETKSNICARFSPEKVTGIIGRYSHSPAKDHLLTEDSHLNTSDGATILQG